MNRPLGHAPLAPPAADASHPSATRGHIGVLTVVDTSDLDVVCCEGPGPALRVGDRCAAVPTFPVGRSRRSPGPIRSFDLLRAKVGFGSGNTCSTSSLEEGGVGERQGLRRFRSAGTAVPFREGRAIRCPSPPRNSPRRAARRQGTRQSCQNGRRRRSRARVSSHGQSCVLGVVVVLDVEDVVAPIVSDSALLRNRIASYPARADAAEEETHWDDHTSA